MKTVTFVLLLALVGVQCADEWKENVSEKNWKLLTYNFGVATNVTYYIGASVSSHQNCRDRARTSLAGLLNDAIKAVAKCVMYETTEAYGEACCNRDVLPFYKSSYDQFVELMNCVR